MSGQAGQPGGAVFGPRWMSPFVLASGTTFRFVLLIASVLATTAAVYYVIAPPGPARLSADHDRCAAATDFDPDRRVEPAAAAEELRRIDAYAECAWSFQVGRAGWALGGMAALLVVGVTIYALLPWWRIRRRLVPVHPADSPDLAASLAELVRRAGLPRSPAFLIDPVNPGLSGLAFGRLGRYHVCLNAGLVTLHTTDSPAFRAVVLHELAHLRNRDVDTTYLTIGCGGPLSARRWFRCW